MAKPVGPLLELKPELTDVIKHLGRVNKLIFQGVAEFVLCLLSCKGQVHHCTWSLKALTHFFFQFLSVWSSNGKRQVSRHRPSCRELTLAQYGKCTGDVFLGAQSSKDAFTLGPAKICSEIWSDQGANAICLISILRNGDYFDLSFLPCKEVALTGGNVLLKEHWQFLEILLIVIVEWRRTIGI